MEKIDLKWPGWSVESNPFGKKFNLSARKRMIVGSQMLLSFFKKHYNRMGSAVLEYGPFFNPLLTPERFPDKPIFFWERRWMVRNFLRNAYETKIIALAASFTTFDKSSLRALKERTIKALKEKGFEDAKFDSIVASQCFNYMDYKAFLSFACKFAKKGTLLFVNNAPGYGVKRKFSKKGPKTNEETLQAIKKNGFKIVEKKFFALPKKSAKHKRMIVVARFAGKN